MIRLLKPLSYYKEHYGTWMYGLNKLYLMMEKQHNRGQEGAGLACVKLDAAPGEEYMFRERAMGTTAIQEIFSNVHAHFKDIPQQQLSDPAYAVRHLPLQAKSIWATSGIPLPASVVFLISTPFCAVTTGGPRTFASVPTST